ncbi:MAG TPA: ECF-type sigma factor [Kofleriaceae bacterium]|nr:ECF-type sigma factor [Kofleriaceae bacterium]
MADGPATVTLLLRAWRAGDRSALDALLPQVYAELHRLAVGVLRGERPGHTLRATELVSEAYLRLGGGQAPASNDRVHFFALAARSMRQVLVDHARRRGARRRGGGERPLPLDDGLIAADRPDDLLDLDEALDALSRDDERKARVVELHYFGGLTHAEIASALELHATTVARDLRFAEAWLRRHIREAAAG